jgi:hypothetical protein
MARAIATANAERHAAYEPLYDTQNGVQIEVFFAEAVLAKSFGTRQGWFWWSCRPGSLPGAPTGPFGTSYLAYRDALRPRRHPRCRPRWATEESS